ncbi:MAG: cytochrome C552 [Thermodesulfobacterium geofontis]|uniref:Cytochrome C552 n=1 Tax=Thermodesulfobacterium geofontis TaxID=1295609 RepID=A0A2N7QGQ9_9BACT|nr:MAG: cytochrome C552 [Thermodesulfobacterium geofontis]
MKVNKFLIIGIFIGFLIVHHSNIFAANGERIFKELRCNACHNLKEDTFAPALKSISKAYKNKKESLVKYLKGEAKAIVDPDREDFMKPYINQTKNLENKDLEKLVDYLLSS